MIMDLNEARRRRADRARPDRPTTFLTVQVAAVSLVDDIFTVVCNGDQVGQECPEWDWIDGETSGLADAKTAVEDHLRAHQILAQKDVPS